MRRAALVSERHINLDASPNTVNSKDLRVMKTQPSNRKHAKSATGFGNLSHRDRECQRAGAVICAFFHEVASRRNSFCAVMLRQVSLTFACPAAVVL